MKRITPYLLTIPFLLLILVFGIGILNGIVQSFGVIPAFGLKNPTIKYYLEVFRDRELMRSVGYSLWIASISSVFATILGTLLCYFLIILKKSDSAWIHVIKLPILIPHMMVALFTINIFSQTGILSRILYQLGITDSPDMFLKLLYDRHGIGVIIAYLWKEIPFVCYFVMAVMTGISEHLGQAAMGLGASRLQGFIHITLPLSISTIRNAFFIIFAFSFGAYDMPYLLGATLPKALPVMSYIEYTNPDLRHRPYAMVLNVIMILLSLFVSLAYFKNSNGGKQHEE